MLNKNMHYQSFANKAKHMSKLTSLVYTTHRPDNEESLYMGEVKMSEHKHLGPWHGGHNGRA